MDDGQVDRERYYRTMYPFIADRLHVPLATHDGCVALRDCELVPRWVIKGQTIMQRKHIFADAEAVTSFCQTELPDTMQLGGAHAGYLGDREHDRTLYRQNVAPICKAFIIDIDADDYDRRDICDCKPKTVCETCWAACIWTARQVIHCLLERWLGLRHIVHFFSGRRGVHIWCTDDVAFRWTSDQRSAVMSMLDYRLMPWHHEARRELYHLFLEPAYRRYVRSNDPYTEEDVFQKLWPRMDEPISKDPSHLIALPMTIHHDTFNFRWPLMEIENGEDQPMPLRLIKRRPTTVEERDVERMTINIRALMGFKKK